MELKELYKKLIDSGCNRFYIVGIGGPINDDVECLGLHNGIWEVYYIERGQKSKPSFTTTEKDKAIKYYHDYILGQEHWHIIAFTRSLEKFDSYKTELENNGVKIIQNDIPDFKFTGDRVYRLYVTNMDIFKAKKIFKEIPYFDRELEIN
ncbi:hypothetical protein [Alkalitalea saponilacus]|uniref:Uncharacterized protein n=1 Tax=Alkalitalea saponilacus TaxID=889453 RepID=A0A1T5HTZ3_9BACT|nr:hypothetical protein [Alkalitalea saponilacus]ASB50427.1 hypothetical protein CDL62_15360 [Alkalitalea saponilacus]ASB50437.1 hypothetical protein CDL62_15415 [Alkalitalea saponilacus]ASB50509.1 hypothetical protein CDL62_15800 [Alkalitalea saponilacus]SKC24158.1 hypothetical protein SAMN03080601_03451 [Alkalitalea saponilacus]